MHSLVNSLANLGVVTGLPRQPHTAALKTRGGSDEGKKDHIYVNSLGKTPLIKMLDLFDFQSKLPKCYANAQSYFHTNLILPFLNF